MAYHLCILEVFRGEIPTPPAHRAVLKMKILSSTGTPFTQAELEAAFDKVADPADWKNPIYKVVHRDDVHVSVCAVRHFTAASVEVSEMWGDKFIVSSPGYRMGPAGDF